MRRRLLGALIASLALVAVVGGLFYARRRARLVVPPVEVPSIVRALPAPTAPQPPPLSGLDLARIVLDDDGATAPAAMHRVAHLTVEPELQRTATRLLAFHHLPEASIVLVDVASGHVLAYASHQEKGDKRDLCAESRAPAASVFKIVTGAALVEDAGLGPETRQCYCGGEQKLLPVDLEDNPARDRYCTTLAGAMGHSTNAVFARLAMKHLKPAQLEDMAERFAWNGAIPFDGPAEPSELKLPSDPVNFGRTAAGFWNSTLSPVQAAFLSTVVARGGEGVSLRIVDHVTDEKGTSLYTAPDAASTKRIVSKDTAHALTTMMETTVAEGTSYRAFHDKRGTSFLPNLPVAGKTGTLTGAQEQRYYTWFTGFAPSRPVPGVPQVAIGVLVVNGPVWRVKANVIAREMLREYFAEQNVPSVSHPFGKDEEREARQVARRD